MKLRTRPRGRSGRRQRLVRLCRICAAAACVGLLISCEGEPMVGEEGEAPVLFDFSFEPQRVVFEELPAEQIIADTLARLPLRLSVRASDPQADVEDVRFVIMSPLDAVDPYVEGRLERAVGDRFDRSFNLDLPRGGAGAYDIVVYALDAESRLSNQLRGTLRFEVQPGSPPEILSIEAPSTFTPPGTLTLVAVVSDPEGLSDIRSVLVRTPSGAELPMFDDGQTQGDAAARDGRYTASFNVPSASPGPQVFRFRAVDRSGLVSETVEWTITITAS